MTVGDRSILRFVTLLTIWGLALTMVVTNTTVMATAVVPFSRWQGQIAAWYLGVGSLPVSVVPSCSGLDAMSLCVAAILAFPRSWRQRLAGAGAGLVLLLLVNLARIGSLAAAVDSPWFEVLHVIVWPAILIVTTAAWVYGWVRATETGDPGPGREDQTRRFAVWAAVCLGLYLVAVPVLASVQVLDVFARDLASMAASTLVMIGVTAEVRGNLLVAGHAPYLVTSDCVTTPLMALYVAAVAAAPISVVARVAWAAAFVPVFVALAVLRLLTVALPPVVFGSPLFVTHAFYQIVLAAIVVAGMAVAWRADRRPAAVAGVVIAALSAGLAVGLLAGALYTRAIIDAVIWMGAPGAASLAEPAASDLQGVVSGLPAFQLAVFVALVVVVWRRVSPRRAAVGAAVLAGSQVITFTVLATPAIDVTSNTAALALRAWALVMPGAVIAGMLRRHQT